MGQRGADVSNDRYLLIRLLLPADAAAGAQCRTGTVRRHQQLTVNDFAALKRKADALLAATDRFHFRRTVQRDAWRLAQQTKQPLADIVEFNHLAQRRQAIIRGRQIHKPGMTAVADVYSLDGRRAFGEALPDTDTRQLLAGARSQGDRRSSKPGWREECGSCASMRWTGSAPPVKREMASASVAPVIPPPTISTLMTGAPPPSAPRSHPPSSPRRR